MNDHNRQLHEKLQKKSYTYVAIAPGADKINPRLRPVIRDEHGHRDARRLTEQGS
jgi:hypothetical protein